MVTAPQIAHEVRAETKADDSFVLPYRPQTGELLTIVVGMPGSLLSSLATVYFLFTTMHNPMLGYLAIATIWTVYFSSMAMLWFAASTDPNS